MVVTEGHCLAVNNLHRGMAQAVSRWAVTAVSSVLTWVSAYGICGMLSGPGTGYSLNIVHLLRVFRQREVTAN